MVYESTSSNARPLSLERVTRRFGGLVALSEVTFDLRPGEILGVIGPNGAGKTTLFNVITGFLPLSAGKVLYGDRELSGLRAHKVVNLGIARSFQIARPFRGMTVQENILVAANSHRGRARGGTRTDEVASACLERVSLEKRRNDDVGVLPQGDLRRLEIARALATHPDVLLLDEPFSGLSYREMEGLAALIRELHAEGRSIFLIEHKLKMLMALAERVLVLNFGELIAVGTPAQVVEDDRVVQAYLGRSGRNFAGA
jgi:branched-chain amino acid transport system ATP-binding protein